MSYEKVLKELGIPYRVMYNKFVKVFEVNPDWNKLSSALTAIKSTDAVIILVVDKTNQQFIMVQQKRVPLISLENPMGITIECVGGRLDKKGKTIKEIMIEELREEIGLDVAEDQIQILNGGVPVASSSGILTEKNYLAVVEIEGIKQNNSDLEETFGNSEEGESIKRVFIDIKDVIEGKVTFQGSKSFGLVYWYLFDRNINKIKKAE